MSTSILLIEDNQDNSLLFCYILKKAGFSVTSVFTAEEAAKVLETFKPDIILSDVSLPGISGNEFLKRIRSSKSLSHICAIAVSAYAREEDKIRTLQSGYDAFIEKPINAESFAQEVIEIYERKQEQYTSK